MRAYPKQKRVVDRALLDKYKFKYCLACGTKPSEPCHIHTVGSKAPDADWNVVPFCRKHHSQQHNEGWPVMYQSYPEVYIFLISNGWVFDETGALWNDKLRVELPIP